MTQFYLSVCPSPKSSLNSAELETIRKFSEIFKKNPLKIKTLFASSAFSCIQAADLIHDMMKVKIKIAHELDLSKTSEANAALQVESLLKKLESENKEHLILCDLVFLKNLQSILKISSDQLSMTMPKLYLFSKEGDAWNIKEVIL